MTDSSSTPTTTAHGFLVITIAGALVTWDIGFELGAFATLSYRRVFAAFVLSTVVLIATFLFNDDEFHTSPLSRVILGLPMVYVLSDILWLTASQTVVNVLVSAILLTSPFALYVIARLVDVDFFTMERRHQVAAVAVMVLIGVLGWYVGDAHDRFLTCDQFERVGDFVPDDCADPNAPAE